MRLEKLSSVLILALSVFAIAASAQDAAKGGAKGMPADPAAKKKGPAAPAMTLTSTAFADGAIIPDKYTQAGAQISPALTWTNAPAGTQGFFLHMHDLEVARNKTTDDQVHWIVWNIPATSTGLPEGVKEGFQLQDGSFQMSASGMSYRGPGAGANGPRHHYTFEIYALDMKLSVPLGADAFETRATIMKAIQGHVIGKAVYMGLFRRPQ